MSCGDIIEKDINYTLTSLCSPCRNMLERERHENKSDEEKEKIKIHKKKKYIENIVKYRLYQAEKRALAKKWLFDIDKEFITNSLLNQNNKCYYSNILFDNNSNLYSMSLDRLDSNKGYTKDNVVLCCSMVNYMKAEYPLDLFLNVMNKILNNMKVLDYQ